jgi:hypothetical protein
VQHEERPMGPLIDDLLAEWYTSRVESVLTLAATWSPALCCVPLWSFGTDCAAPPAPSPSPTVRKTVDRFAPERFERDEYLRAQRNPPSRQGIRVNRLRHPRFAHARTGKRRNALQEKER